MVKYQNSINQPIGPPLTSWQSCQHPKGLKMKGQMCRLEPIDSKKHSRDLFNAYALDRENRNWTYLPYGPFVTLADFQAWIERDCLSADPYFFAIIDIETDRAAGLASYLRIKPVVGVIEVGHIHFSRLLQGRAISTEVMYLMMQMVFDELGYRRYEWKCDALNAPSCSAANRLGFKFEGIFRQATIYKQRNRDTAWYSILDSEWPTIKPIFEKWLCSDNFDTEGRQYCSLSQMMSVALDR